MGHNHPPGITGFNCRECDAEDYSARASAERAKQRQALRVILEPLGLYPTPGSRVDSALLGIANHETKPSWYGVNVEATAHYDRIAQALEGARWNLLEVR